MYLIRPLQNTRRRQAQDLLTLPEGESIILTPADGMQSQRLGASLYPGFELFQKTGSFSN